MDKRKKKDKHKELTFGSVFTARLFSLHYTVAEPRPDTGEDLWFAPPVTASSLGAPRIVYRAQLESAYPNKNSTATRREYDVNDYLRSFAYALCQPTFLYVFGLYDGQFKERGDAYHVGCLPMIYLRQVVERTTRYQSRGCIELPDAGVGTGNYQDRYCIQFTVRKSDRRGGDFSYSMCIRRGGTLNVTDFFRDIEYGLRIASGTEPLPSLDWLSGPRQNASVNEAGLVAYPESSKGAML